MLAHEFIDKIRLLQNKDNEMPSSFLNDLHYWAFEAIVAIAFDERLDSLSSEKKQRCTAIKRGVSVFLFV